MFSFFKGIASAITSKTRKKDQWLYDTTNKTLYLDIDENGTVTRYPVKDPDMAALDGHTFLIL